MKRIAGYLLIIFFMISLVGAQEENEEHEEIFAQAESIMQQRTPCNELTSNQLEILGDYFMEQMHPDELHEIMDERMGGEGSASLRQVHINMGLMFYCGQKGAMSSSMMNMMMGRTGIAQGSMMRYGDGFGMMNNFQRESYNNSDYSGILEFGVIGWIFAILIIVIMILIIAILIKQLQKK